ncbi:hypothetical protein DRN46_05625 [Thermococci archaeon]|nr:MAG: hypothetical protein DRN46_05625 [Thermococci archaeon]
MSICSPKRVKRLLIRKGPVEYSLNTYEGCEHSCPFCFSRREDEKIFGKVNAHLILRNELKASKRGFITLNTSSDPYQPCEEELKITRRVLEVMRDYRFSCHVMTKSDLVVRDLEVLREISERGSNCFVSFSLISLEDGLEGSSPSPKRRIRALEKVSSHGIKTGVLLMPILPFITDDPEEIEELLHLVKEKGGSYAIPGILILREPEKRRFFYFLSEEYPELVGIYSEMYRGSSPSRRYLSELEERLRETFNRVGISDRLPLGVPVGGSASTSQEEGRRIQERKGFQPI